MKKQEAMYIVRKYIMATCALQAIKKDKGHPVNDVWIDENWKKDNPMGFTNQKL